MGVFFCTQFDIVIFYICGMVKVDLLLGFFLNFLFLRENKIMKAKLNKRKPKPSGAKPEQEKPWKRPKTRRGQR